MVSQRNSTFAISALARVHTCVRYTIFGSISADIGHQNTHGDVYMQCIYRNYNMVITLIVLFVVFMYAFWITSILLCKRISSQTSSHLKLWADLEIFPTVPGIQFPTTVGIQLLIQRTVVGSFSGTIPAESFQMILHLSLGSFPLEQVRVMSLYHYSGATYHGNYDHALQQCYLPQTSKKQQTSTNHMEI